MKASVLLVVTSFLVTLHSVAQTSKRAVDSSALNILQTAYATLGGSPDSIKLSGTATWSTASSDSPGSLSLEVLGTNFSRIDVGAASIVEVRDSSSSMPAGQWTDAEGTLHDMAMHNCWAAAGWFLPHAFITAALGGDAAAVYMGRETHNGLTVDHILYQRIVPAKTTAAAKLYSRLTAVDLYTDPTTSVPLFVDFNLHPDADMKTDLPVEMRFFDYRQVNGFLVPFRIERFLQGDLQFDAVIDQAIPHAPISSSDFTLR